MDKFLDWFLHIGLSIVYFGLGYFLSEALISNNNGSIPFERYFWFLFLIALIPVGFYELTYKYYKSKMRSNRFWLIAILIYVLSPISGYLFSAIA